MEKTLVALKKDFSTLRAGRANPQILDKITVDYYGTPTPLSGVANISSPEPRMLVIAPWEAKMITPIEKEIQKSDLGINPSNDGRVIRLIVPELNEERRKELCKQVKKAAEESKVAVRNIRRDAMEAFKKMKKDSRSPRMTRRPRSPSFRRSWTSTSKSSTTQPPRRKKRSCPYDERPWSAA